MSSSPDPFQSYFDSHEPKQELDSPFLNEALFVDEEREATSAWENRLNRLQLESPFLRAFEERWGASGEAEFAASYESLDQLGEAEFEEALDSFQVNDFSQNEAEAENDEMRWEPEDEIEDFYNQEEDYLEVQQWMPEETWIESEEEEDAYPLAKVAYAEEAQLLDADIFSKAEEFLRLLSPGAIGQRVKQLLDQGMFSWSLLGRFASGQIWNEDHLALEILFHRQPQLRPAHLDTVSEAKRLPLLRNLAVDHQRALTPIREGIVRPIFGNPANFEVGPVGECKIHDLREEVRKLGPLPGGKNKQGVIWYKRDAHASLRPQATIDSIVLHHMAYNIGNNVNSYKKVGAHYIVTADGQIAQLYNDLDFLNASNGFNPRSVAIEFAGNFSDPQYHWWKSSEPPIPPIPDRCYLTPMQIRAGRCLLAMLKTRLPEIKYLYAHRQSSAIRPDDPGPDVWFNIGEFALSTLNLTDRLPRTHVGDGQPIPETWRKSRPAMSVITVTPPKPLPNTTSPAADNRLASGSVDKKVVALVKKYQSLADEAARRYGVDSALILGVIAAESGGNKDLVAKSGYTGLMQAENKPDQREAHKRPEVSIDAGTKKLRDFRKTMEDVLKERRQHYVQLPEDEQLRLLALAYNAGAVTIAKALQYAAEAGSPERWLDAEYYKRALLFTGAYSLKQAAASCLKGMSPPEQKSRMDEAIEVWNHWRLGTKKTNWRKLEDPPAWSSVSSSLPPFIVCAIDFKHRNSPKYAAKILAYRNRFQSR